MINLKDSLEQSFKTLINLIKQTNKELNSNQGELSELTTTDKPI